MSDKLFIEPVEEWTQFLGKCNWYDFHLIHIYVENDTLLGGIEFSIIVLGLGFKFRYNHTETETLRDIREAAKELNDMLDEDAKKIKEENKHV